MKIILVGDPFGVQDIGERTVVRGIFDALSKYNDLLVMQPRDIFKLGKVLQFINFRPDLIHYWAGPRFQSFVILWVFKLIGRGKPTILTSIRPQVSKVVLLLARLIRPTLILSQSENYRNLYIKYGFMTKLFPNGIDTKKYVPITGERKKYLRSKYQIPVDQFVILHVGHITKRRSLDVFSKFTSDKSIQIVIVASTSIIKPEEQIIDKLKSAGCIVIEGFLEHIEEIYQLSDCYVFPGGINKENIPFIFPRKNVVPSIEIPVSVLEAMSCGIAVVTSRFGGLDGMFNDSDWFRFVDDLGDISQNIESIRRLNSSCDNRQKVLDFDWERLGNKLISMYYDIYEKED